MYDEEKEQRIFSIFTLKKKTKLSIIRFVGVIIIIIYGGIFYNSDNLKEQFWEKANPPSESKISRLMSLSCLCGKIWSYNQ